jgi:large repetitive protein
MRKYLLSLLIVVSVLSPGVVFGQATCPTVNAGPDQTICVPNCATLTATVTATQLPGTTANAYTVAQIPYAPDPFNVGTLVPLSDDQWSMPITIPFQFCFYGNTYTQLLIGSNGVVKFDLTGAGGYCTWPIPNTPVPTAVAGTPINAIMGPWQDLNPGVGGSVRYTTYGVAPCRRFVVSWFNVPMFSCGTPATQQITIYETTNIIDNYIQNKPLCANWNGGKAIQAIQNFNGTQAVVVAGRNTPTQWTTTNDARRYTPNGASNTSIQWLANAVPVGTGTSITVCPTQNTTYTCQVTYTMCNNTTVTISDQVIVNVSQLLVDAGLPQQVCLGGQATLTCTAPGATTWQWFAGPPPANPLGNTATINVSPNSTTTYYAVATDPSGCSGVDSVTITTFVMNTASAGADDSICTGNCTTLNASGGVSYAWTPVAAIQSGANTATPTVCPTATTQFTVSVTDANGCVGTDSATVHVASQVLSSQISGVNASCFGSCNGSATVTPAGGFPPYSVSWNTVPAQTGVTATGLCAGSYTATITDAIGCTTTASVTITEPTDISIQTTNITTANCGLNDGSVSITVTGGTPLANGQYNILWSTGGTGLTENNLAPGQVCVYITDANLCTDTLCVVVPNTPGATISVTSTSDALCFNSCDGIVVTSAAGGTAPFTYSWNGGPFGNSDDSTTLCAGNYTIILSDANGCLDTVSATINQPTAVTNAAAAAPATICIGQSSTLTATPGGGSPGYQYQWADANGPIIGQTQSTMTVSPTVTTTYFVAVVDANGCVGPVAPVTVTVNPPLQVTALADITVCQNTLVNLTCTGSGGDGNLTYNWAPIGQQGNNVPVNITGTTTFVVTVSDGCGTPVATDNVVVTVNPAPVVNIAATTDISGCEDLCVSFINNTPNTASITWTFGNNLGTSNSPTPTFCFNDAGTYDVTATVTDVIGCVSTFTLSNYVTVWPLPNAAFSYSPTDPTALNNVVDFTDQSSGATTWTWSIANTVSALDTFMIGQNPSFAFPGVGTFDVQLTVTNQYGCTDDVIQSVIVKEDYAVYIPNAFTPNGDGINDVFFPQGIGINTDRFEMYIFDRWGNMIYQTNRWPGGWDGTVQGSSRMCQIDTYVYKIVTVDPDGSRRQYIGGVNLIR